MALLSLIYLLPANKSAVSAKFVATKSISLFVSSLNTFMYSARLDGEIVKSGILYAGDLKLEPFNNTLNIWQDRLGLCACG